MKYSQYLQSNHWKGLRVKHIQKNRHAKCFVCATSERLLLHHVSYLNLDNERFNRDIYIVCFNCHPHLNFVWFKSFKLPLKKKYLVSILYWRRFEHSMQQGKVLSAISSLLTLPLKLLV